MKTLYNIHIQGGMEMRKYLIISHNKLAEGMKDTVEFFVGENKELYFINCYLDNEPVNEKLKRFTENLNVNDELIIFTDLIGGSVNQEAIKLLGKDKIHVIAGFNLALIVEVILLDASSNLIDEIPSIVEKAKKSICYMNTYKFEMEEED